MDELKENPIDNERVVDNIDDVPFTRENFINSLRYSQKIQSELENYIQYSEYIVECLDKTMDYSNQLAEKFNFLHDFIELKFGEGYSTYCTMKKEGKSDIEIKAFFRKDKIKNLLDE